MCEAQAEDQSGRVGEASITKAVSEGILYNRRNYMTSLYGCDKI